MVSILSNDKRHAREAHSTYVCVCRQFEHEQRASVGKIALDRSNEAASVYEPI